MTDKNLLHHRYPDLFESDKVVDPALERLVTDLEIIYPPASYPSSLPEQLLSALETHIDHDDFIFVEPPVTAFPPLARSIRASRERWEKRWQRPVGTLAAVVLTALLVSSLLLVLHQSHQPDGNTANTATTTNSTWSFSMINATTGWAQIEEELRTHSAVLHTTDAGSHWQNVTPRQFPDPASDIFYAQNATTAWIAGSVNGKSGTQSSLLLRTTDSGQTWQPIALPAAISSSIVSDINFLNTQVSWIEVQTNNHQEPHAFWLTNDGGKTWQRFAIPSITIPPNDVDRLLLSFFDEKTWALTDYTLPMSDGKPIIYVTRNAGSTWQQQVLPVPAGISLTTSGASANLQTFSATDGVLEVLDEKGHFFAYITHDGGKNWQYTTLVSLNHAEFVMFSDINHGETFATPYIDAPGKLAGPHHLTMISTSDGGQHWRTTPVSLPPGQQGQSDSLVLITSDFVTSDFVSPQVGWLAVDLEPSSPDLPHNGLYKTVDGGRTWIPVSYQIQNYP